MKPGPNSLALRHHFAVHGAGAAIAAVADAGQTAGGHPAVRAAAGRNQRLVLGLAEVWDAEEGAGQG